MRVLLRRKTVVIGTGQRIPHRWLFEWNPRNGRWYSINSRNIVPATLSNPEFTAAYRDAMNRILKGGVVEVAADYNRDHKTLLVFNIPRKGVN